MPKESSFDINISKIRVSAPDRELVTLQDALPLTLLIITSIILGLSFFDGLANMVSHWNLEEYSHGYIIPLISLFLFFKKIHILSTNRAKHHWVGLALLLLGFAALVLGELSSLYVMIQYGFLLALTGLLACFLGINGIRLIWPSLAYLIFMIPLPEFIYFNLSSQLQLISSSIGVSFIRLFDISVFLEGNVIDLGNYQLQVVEACSGLRYLFPFMSFGFLLACLYNAPLWLRSSLFLSTIPITVLMNSFRIGLIGLSVNYWGIEAAEGFLHDLEGWVIFVACIGVLLIEICLLSKLIKPTPTNVTSYRFDLEPPEKVNLKIITTILPVNINHKSPSIIAFIIVLIGFMFVNSLNERTEHTPNRIKLNFLPLIKGDWTGRESALKTEVLDALNVSDYVMANYSHKDDSLPVNLYIAYYESQRKGASIHSPRACIPGGGWEITEFSTKNLEKNNFSPVDIHDSLPQKINRVVIQKGKDRSLVYYWFQQRGRIITNEYLAKWYLFWDGLTINRTDGALVRLITPAPAEINILEADKKLLGFLQEFNPILNDYIPD